MDGWRERGKGDQSDFWLIWGGRRKQDRGVGLLRSACGGEGDCCMSEERGKAAVVRTRGGPARVVISSLEWLVSGGHGASKALGQWFLTIFA